MLIEKMILVFQRRRLRLSTHDLWLGMIVTYAFALNRTCFINACPSWPAPDANTATSIALNLIQRERDARAASVIMAAATASNCSFGADGRFGPRVDTSCRSFYFTLLFEDAFFATLPAAVFLLLLPWRLHLLLNSRIKVVSYKLANWKLVGITARATQRCAY